MKEEDNQFDFNVGGTDDNLNDGGNQEGSNNFENYGFQSETEQDIEDNRPIDEDDINISDRTAPIIMLFGPPSSGKSMTLVRLARFLRKNGYVVKPDHTFKADNSYRVRCDKFCEDLNTSEALKGTGLNEFLMVKVVNHGKTICQILEAPGEHYFNPNKPSETGSKDFRAYLTQIIRNLPNRKIWTFLVESEWNVHATIKRSYVERIRTCKNQLLRRTDSVILLYNKVDQKEELIENGRINLPAANKAMMDEYEGLAPVFRNTNPITQLWQPYKYKFVPFTTGYYTKKEDGKLRYNESEEKFPRMLWEAITKAIRG